jgi:hypothetical protein
MQRSVFKVEMAEQAAARESYAVKKFRSQVFADTIKRMNDEAERARCLDQARANHARWKAEVIRPSKVEVFSEDWGAVTQRLSKENGVIYAVLNMANAYSPGGGVIEGSAAQEENMFRRTDCFQFVTEDDVTPEPITRRLRYKKTKTDLIEGKAGEIYLDTDNPRLCFRQAEQFKKDPGKDASKDQITGYEFLPDEELFLFYEMRAAAQDCSSPLEKFDEKLARKKIRAQLDTCIQKNIRHVVLSAFGCGAFKNPAEVIARIYQEELQARLTYFDHVAFAVYYPGYGPDNAKVFEEVFAQQLDKEHEVSLGNILTHSVTSAINEITTAMKALNLKATRNRRCMSQLYILATEFQHAANQYKPVMNKDEFAQYAHTHQTILHAAAVLEEENFSEKLKMAVAIAISVITLSLALALTFGGIVIPALLVAIFVPTLATVSLASGGYSIFKLVQNHKNAKPIEAAYAFAEIMEENKPVVR